MLLFVLLNLKFLEVEPAASCNIIMAASLKFVGGNNNPLPNLPQNNAITLSSARSKGNIQVNFYNWIIGNK